MDEKELKLRSYLKERFANYEDSIGPEDSMEGIVDSLGLFELVAFIEEEFAITIPNEDFSPDLFSTIEKILLLINGDQPT
jgi:acyl carrier protein